MQKNFTVIANSTERDINRSELMCEEAIASLLTYETAEAKTPHRL